MTGAKAKALIAYCGRRSTLLGGEHDVYLTDRCERLMWVVDVYLGLLIRGGQDDGRIRVFCSQDGSSEAPSYRLIFVSLSPFEIVCAKNLSVWWMKGLN